MIFDFGFLRWKNASFDAAESPEAMKIQPCPETSLCRGNLIYEGRFFDLNIVSMNSPQILEDRLINFAVGIINVVEELPVSKAGSHIAGQLIRSGTSPAPNYAEARGAESKRDFIHKLKISLKELRESLVWLKIIERKKMSDPDELATVTRECNELISIFVSSTKTADGS
jgi:four helix bundle protein